MSKNLIKKGLFPAFLGLFLSCSSSFSEPAKAGLRKVHEIAFLISAEIPSPSHRVYDPLLLSRYIVRLSDQQKVDPLLVLAIIKVESQFRPFVRSGAGAVGLMQVMPIVIREVGKEVNIVSRQDLYDPYKNVLLGLRYFTFLRKKYQNDLLNTLVAYNMGPTALDEILSDRRNIPTRYFQKVMKAYKEFLAKAPIHPLQPKII